jgi:hypothetical protein
MPTILQKIERERNLARTKESVQVETMVLVTLSAEAKSAIDLAWCKGLGSKRTLIVLKPGESVQQPLDKTRAWFGPWDRFAEYEVCRDEAITEVLRDHIAIESARFLNGFDYPRGTGRGYNPSMDPVGPHRAPDVVLTKLFSDGTRGEPIRIHEVYGIGEFDDLKFDHKPSVEELEAHYQAKLRDRDVELQGMREMLVRLEGKFDGAVLGATATAIASEKKHNGREQAPV